MNHQGVTIQSQIRFLRLYTLYLFNRFSLQPFFEIRHKAKISNQSLSQKSIKGIGDDSLKHNLNRKAPSESKSMSDEEEEKGLFLEKEEEKGLFIEKEDVVYFIYKFVYRLIIRNMMLQI